MASSQSLPSIVSNWTLLPLLLSLVVPPFLLGGVHLQTYVGMALLSCILLFIIAQRIKKRLTSQSGIFLDRWFWLFVFALIPTMLQLVPLPLSWFSSLAPETAAVFQQTLGAVGLYPVGTQPLSLAPSETAAKLIRDVATVLLYLGALQWSYRRLRLRQLMQISIVAALVMCGIIFLQVLLGMPYPLMGLYIPDPVSHSLLAGSPFLNHNHLSGYLLFHSLLTLPLYVEAYSTRERIGWLTAFCILTTTLLFTLSTYTFLLFVGSLLFFLWMMGQKTFSESETDPTQIDPKYDPLPILAVDPATAQLLPAKTPEEALEEAARRKKLNRNYQRSSRDPKPVWEGWKIIWYNPFFRLLFGVLILVVASTLFVFAKSISPQPEQAKQLSQSSLSPAITVIKHYPMWGVGRGATSLAKQRFASKTALSTDKLATTRSESQWLQPFVEWGIPFGLFFLGCFGFFFWQTVQRTQGVLENSVAIAIAALLLHNITDSNLDFLGTAFPLLIFLASLNRLHLQRQETSPSSTWALPAAGAIGFIVVAVTTPYALSQNYRNLPKQLKALSQKKSQEFQASLKSLVREHPSNFVLPSHAVKYFSKQGNQGVERALKWSKVGLFLNPKSSEAHLLRGRVLILQKRVKEAMAHFNRALDLEPSLLQKVAPIMNSPGLTKEAIPFAKSEIFALTLLQSWRACEVRLPLCIRLAHQASRRNTKALKLVQFTAEMEWRQLLHSRTMEQSSKGSTQKLWQKRLQHWKSKVKQRLNSKQSSLSLLSKGRLAEYEGRFEEAKRYYKEVVKSKNPGRWFAFRLLLKAYKKQLKFKKAHALLLKAQRWFPSRKKLSQINYLEAMLLLKEKKGNLALTRLGEATRLYSYDKYWLKMASTCLKLKKIKCALRIYSRLSQKPENKHLKLKAKQLQKKLDLLK